MKRTPLFMGFIYTIMGALFTYLAIQSAQNSEDIWNFTTIVLVLVATFDFSVAVRVFLLHQKIKRIQNEQKK
ncbi:YdiK family protein [Bacillus sp. CGMCC 1.16541]|uniref:YdiK family protein n=1 Tax=Bacillus sp. CGMCC 1.16541 TaxID=2185143 RepID=UPI000D7292AB|nr:YdiK family protein [Bacillus sp. CGMCC 1.16541]